ncbi:Gag-Pol polyprotein [Merluccius polli]|uniref:Gag-Pol polyprotein n=1 Tax=Merluccius polli TaxID=89951 RepID=A0AA47P4T8_MERPO|nr:Gag-Pol polyprotein [Merluccius polli]
MSDGEGDAAAPAPLVQPPQQANANANAPPSATFTIQPPDAFDFAKPQDWERWIRRFERFRLASNRHLSTEANQVNTLIYCMGDEADDILRGHDLSDAQRQQYTSVRATLETYFVPRKNRVQQPNEAVDAFITALYALAENCKYGALHDELIRDRIVVGLRDTSLAERMQLDKDLTLEKAVNMARQSEVIERQQTDLRGGGRMDIDAITKGRRQKPFTPKSPHQLMHPSAKPQPSSDRQSCYRCGKSPGHANAQCPAREVTCHACGKRGHYSKVCKSTKAVHAVETESCYCNQVQLHFAVAGWLNPSTLRCSVDAGLDPWYADLTIRDHKVRFKIDTGADVSVIPAQTYYAIAESNTQLTKPDRPLFGPGRMLLSVLGRYRESLCKGEQVIQEDVYVVNDLNVALLSRPASVKLKLVYKADSIDKSEMAESYPKLCQGLGMMQQPYTIKLRPDAIPYSLATPRRRFRLRLMRYSYTISHTPGKALFTADTLSRSPVSQNSSSKLTDNDLLEDTNIYVDEIINSMPASSTYMAQLRERLQEDSVCSEVIATPLANGYSPAQLLMGRRLRTPVPQHPSLLTPELPDSTLVAAKEKERRMKDTANFNKRHRVRDLSQLTPGQPVWITDTKSQGTVVSSHSAPRSYMVDGPAGSIRRNRHHLVPFPETVTHTPHTHTPCTPPQPGEPTLGSPERPESPAQTPKGHTPVRTHTRPYH